MASDARPEESVIDQPVLAHRAAAGALWSGLEMAGTQGVSLLIFAVIARYIDPGDFGLISITYLVIYSLKSVVIDTVVVAVARKQNAPDIEYTASFWLTLGFSIVGSLAVFGMAGLAEQIMQTPHLENVMRAMSVIVLFMGLARTHEMRLARSFQFRTLAVRGILGIALGGGIGIALAVSGFGLMALVAQQIATSAISLVLLWTISSWRPTFDLSYGTAANILALMRSMVPTCAVGAVSQNCDTFLVAYFLGPAHAGLYALAKRLRLALQTVVATPINSVAFSALAEVQDDAERLRNVSQKMVATISFVCAPIFVGSSSVAREVVLLAFGERWLDVAPIFAVYSFGGLFASLQIFGDVVFTIKRRQIWTLYNLLLYTVVAVISFPAIRNLEAGYLAVPFVAPYLVTLPLSAVLASRLVGLRLFDWLAAVYPSFVSSLVMFCTIKLVDSSAYVLTSASQVVVCSVVGAGVYLAMMLVLSRTTVVVAFRILSNLVRK